MQSARDEVAKWIRSNCQKTCGSVMSVNLEEDVALIEADEIIALTSLKQQSSHLRIAREALEKIAEQTECWGPNCHYCDTDETHPPTQSAIWAKEALAKMGK